MRINILHYLGAIAIATNQLLNTLTGGQPDSSISARAGFARQDGSKGGRIVCAILNLKDPDGDGPLDHCLLAMDAYKRRHLLMRDFDGDELLGGK